MILSNKIFFVLNIAFLSLPTSKHVKEFFEPDFWLCPHFVYSLYYKDKGPLPINQKCPASINKILALPKIINDPPNKSDFRPL